MSQGGRRPRAGATGRALPWVVLAVVLGLLVMSGLALAGNGRASRRTTGRAASASEAAVRLADLEVTAASVSLEHDTVLLGSATVRNVGAVKARSSTADLAWKAVGTGGLVQIGRFTVPALKPGKHDKAHFQVTVPKGASGSYGLSVCADVLGKIREASKKDKCRAAGVVTIPPSTSGVEPFGPVSEGPSSGSPGGTPSPAPISPSSPPDTMIDSGPSGPIGQASATFIFHGSDTNDTFQCSLDEAPWVTCTSPQSYTGLAEGAHTFRVRAINSAHEIDPTPASATFTVEATPPQTTITSAPSGRIPIGEVSISFTSTEPGSAFQCSFDGASYSPCSSPDVIKDPAAGPHTFNVQATNHVGVKETAAPPSASWSSVEPQHDLCGTISSNTTIGPNYAARYIVTCSTTVASGATLTAQPGTIIKAGQGTRVSAEGTLDAVGTEAEPITFTSINDNSVGGATGSGSPRAGDWEGILVGGEGSLRLGYAAIDYAIYGIQGENGQGGDDLGAFSVTHSSISDSLQEGLFVRFGSTDTPTISDDTVDDSGGPAMAIEGTNLSASTLSGNSGAGNHGGMFIGGAITASGTISESGLDPTIGAQYVTSELTVAPGATLKIPAGQTWKGDDHGQLLVEGTIEAEGTASEPVTFTSINDGTVGGHANGEGEEGPPKPGDWEGILVGGEGSLRLGYAAIDYAIYGIQGENGQGGDDLGAFSVTHSSISDSLQEGLFVRFGSTDTPTISDDTVDDSGGPAMAIEGTNLSASTLSGNSGAGNHGGMFIGGAITASGTISESGLDPTIGAQYVTSELTVAPGATLKIPAGQTWKGDDHGQLLVEGTIEAEGTASEPVTFTSINDNSVGGATGSGSPAPGDWEGIAVDNGGSADLDGTTLDYAATALSVAEEAQVTITGAILHSTVGVSSHAYVEATGVNWGSPSGPAPFGTGTPIEGEVLAKPWVGYVAPSIPPEPPYEAPSEKFANCGDYFVIGARGSGEDPQGNPPVYSSNEDGFGSRDYNAYYGLKKVIEADGVPESDFNVLGLRYRALGVEAAALINEEYDESIWEGVAALKQVLHEREMECPSEPAILVGYSQGALVIHLALRELQESDPSMLSPSRIAGVMLIADPAKVGGESEPVWEEENEPAAPGSGIFGADGLWTKIGGSHDGPLPSAVAHRAISFCANHDIVCAPGFGSHISVHTGYYQAGNLNAMGEWMARRILGLN